jgi:hypothetical protein
MKTFTKKTPFGENSILGRRYRILSGNSASADIAERK